MAIVGIDLGTTNSLIGIIEKGRPRLFVGENGSALVPSVVHYKNNEVIVGAQAKKDRVEYYHDTLFSVKRFMGRGKKDVDDKMKTLPFDFSPSDEKTIRFKVANRTLTPIEVSADILKTLKHLAEKQLGEKVGRAVITVPAYFNDSQRQATKLAGELAGLEVCRIINEPTAAALAYGLDKKAHGLVAVYDLGGGTFDISILRIKDGIFEVLATGGDTALGGDDFDEAIASHLSPELSKLFGGEILSHPCHRSALLAAVEKLKRELSEKENAEISLVIGGKTFRQTISKIEMESWIHSVLERSRKPCLDCLADSGVTREQLSDVVLVGGSTLMPRVRAFVKEIFGREPICSLNPEEVVAMGATVQANVLAGKMGEVLLLDVIPLSLGIETMGGIVSKIIHRNSTIPVSATEHFSTFVDGQTNVDIHVLQGERELAKDNRSLARFQLKGIPPLPAGIPKIEVEFIVDANGILQVRATELRTGMTAAISVSPSYGLSDTEVEKMLTAAFENAEKDYEDRFLIEARTEADSIVRAARKSLERGHALISKEEVATITKSLEQLENEMNQKDHKKIKAAIEDLNAKTRNLAETLLNQAVSEALKDKKISEERKPV